MPHKLYQFIINVDMRILSEEDKAELLRNLQVSGQISRIRMNLKGAILFDIVDGDNITSVLTFGDRIRDNKQEYVTFDPSKVSKLEKMYGIDFINDLLALYKEDIDNEN